MWVRKCRLCDGKLVRVLNLGKMPVVNYFPKLEERGQTQNYPLVLCSCSGCGLLQLGFLLAPEKLFEKYHYVSGASIPLIDHLRKLAVECMDIWGVAGKMKILDVGCNDGSFLNNFGGELNLWGVDPSGIKPSNTNINLVKDYFSLELAQRLKKNTGGFDLVVCTHTLACVENIKDFVAGIAEVLVDNGLCVVEVGSAEKMISQGSFDCIYHEHYSYFDENSLRLLFGLAGLGIVKIERNEFHGGSTRIFLKKNKKELVGVKNNLEQDKLDSFVLKVGSFRKRFRKIIKNIKGQRLVVVSVPAKGVTLLNFCGVDKTKLRLVVDSTIQKQGRLIPGIEASVSGMESLVGQEGDVYLILAWNYREVILEKIKSVALPGSFVLVPFPELEMVKM